VCLVMRQGEGMAKQRDKTLKHEEGHKALGEWNSQ
jgi:hypothetical protein